MMSQPILDSGGYGEELSKNKARVREKYILERSSETGGGEDGKQEGKKLKEEKKE